MKRISIVFAETDNEPLGDKKGTGQGFAVFLEGFDQSRLELYRMGGLKNSDLSAAEFWALKMWTIVMDLLRKTGVVVKEERRG